MTTRPPFILGCEDMVKLVPKLMEILPVGRDNAVTGKELAVRFGFSDDRKIRLAIRDLIARGVPVASSVVEPFGYYKCADEYEAMAYVNDIEARINENQSRLRDFKAACDKSKFSIPVQATFFGGLS